MLTGGAIKIAFLIANINAWYSVGTLIDAMQKDNAFEVTVFSIHKRFPGQTDYSGEEKVHQFLNEKNVPHIRLAMPNSFHGLEILRSFAPHVIFRQSQWEADYPPAFNSQYLGFAHLINIPYELVNFLQVAPNVIDDVCDFTIDSLFHRRCSRDLVLSDGISFLIEVQFLGKDILFLERGGHFPFNEIGQTVSQGFIPVKNVQAAEIYIQKMLNNEPLGLREKQLKGLQQCFPKTNCVQNIIDDLKHYFQAA